MPESPPWVCTCSGKFPTLSALLHHILNVSASDRQAALTIRRVLMRRAERASK
jgi:hypothetical protein